MISRCFLIFFLGKQSNIFDGYTVINLTLVLGEIRQCDGQSKRSDSVPLQVCVRSVEHSGSQAGRRPSSYTTSTTAGSSSVSRARGCRGLDAARHADHLIVAQLQAQLGREQCDQVFDWRRAGMLTRAYYLSWDLTALNIGIIQLEI